MTRQQILDALTAERYGQPVREHHNTYAPDPPRALRLVHRPERVEPTDDDRRTA